MGQGATNQALLARGKSAPAPARARPEVQGQDVSGWQAAPNTNHTVSTVNWSQQWAMGSRFVYVKATEGSAFVDGSRKSHLTGAKSVGMLSGAYHFALPGDSTAKNQANHFVNNGGGWVNDGKTLAPLLDIENNPYEVPGGRPYLGNNCYNLTPAAMVTWIKDFSNQVYIRTGRLPMIYTNYYWWQECTANSTQFANQALHIAAYGAPTPWIPGGWKGYDFWQYSSTGPFAGDSNVWNGTIDSLKKFASSSSASVTPPSIPTTADVVAADSAGTLWNYPATKTAALGSRVKIGSGWQNFRSINVVDWNADGILDLVAQWNNGVLNVYKGLPAGGFEAPVTLGTGWAENHLSIGFWNSTSPYPQILARTPGGSVQWWTNSSGTRISQGPEIGQGWGALNLTMIDVDGDGKQDIVASNSAGNLTLYRSDGTGKFVNENRRLLATGWQNTASIAVSSGLTAASSSELVVKDKAGNLSYVPVPGNTTLGKATSIGFGWSSFRIAGGEEFSFPAPPPVKKPSIKASSDVVTVDKAGAAWRYPTSGTKLGTGEKIGHGFGMAKSLHVVDWNADGILDLLMQTSTGSLNLLAGLADGGFAPTRVLSAAGWADADITTGQWIRAAKYPGLVAQRPDGSLTAYTTSDGVSLTAARSIGHGFLKMHPVMADYDGDGKADIGVVDEQGRLVLYRSNGTGSFIRENRRVIGVGWQGMTSVSPARNYTSTNSQGLLARTSAGNVIYYPVEVTRFSPPTTLATGWDTNLISGSSRISEPPYPLNISDLVTVDAAGTLWHSRSTGKRNLTAPRELGFGWLNVKGLHVVDWNADGVADVLTQWNNGSVTVHFGLLTGGIGTSRVLAANGWSGVSFITGRWLSDSKYPGLIGTNSAGHLFYWPNTSGTGLGTATQIGNGWGILSIAMIDFDKNGHQDILAVDASGYMRLYRGSGVGPFVAENRSIVGNGWGTVKQFSGVSGYAGEGSAGLMTIIGDTQPRYYPLVSSSTWGAPTNASVQVNGTLISR